MKSGCHAERRGRMTIPSSDHGRPDDIARTSDLEIRLNRELHESRLQNQVRHLPNPLSARYRRVRVVLSFFDVGGVKVIDVVTDLRTRGTEFQNLRKTHVDLGPTI